MSTIGAYDRITFTAIDGTEINLHDPYGTADRYAIAEYQGVGAPPLEISPHQHGLRAGEVLPYADYKGRTFSLLMDAMAHDSESLDALYRNFIWHTALVTGSDEPSYGILRRQANPSVNAQGNTVYASDRSIRCGLLRGAEFDQRSEVRGFRLRMQPTFLRRVSVLDRSKPSK